MPTLTVSTLVHVSHQITIYVGATIFFAGIIGGLLNISVFLSLRTFRENSCAFYLIVMSFVNIGNLMTGLLSRIIISGFGIDWTLNSSYFCKFRWYGLQFCVLTSFTCACLATIDQYMATCARVRWHQWSNIKIAHHLTRIFIIIWLLHGMLYIYYFDLIQSPTTNRISCDSENIIFRQYHIYGYLVFLAGVLPLIVTSFFGLLAHNNLRYLAHQAIPFVQLHLDKQLTAMVLAQLIHNFIFTLPYTTLTSFKSFSKDIQNPIIIASLDFANVMVILLYYLSFAVSLFFLLHNEHYQLCCSVLSIFISVHLNDSVNN
jgi:hypothetical protein